MNFHLARWHFWWGYAILLVLLIVAMWFNDSAQDLQAVVFYIFAAIVFVVLELAIRTQKIWFEKDGFTFTKRRNTTFIKHHELSSVDVSQSFLQNFLGYGTISIKKRNGEVVCLKNFEQINKIKRLLK